MLSKCSNPDCSTPFKYLGSGKLFLLDDANASPQKELVFKAHWLCNACSAEYKVVAQNGGAVVVPLTDPATRTEQLMQRSLRSQKSSKEDA